jgi:hypothetical protein
MSESTSDALDYLRSERVPAVVLEPHVDADTQTVMAAADHVEELLPHPVERKGFSMREHLDPITYEQMKALMRAVV